MTEASWLVVGAGIAAVLAILFWKVLRAPGVRP